MATPAHDYLHGHGHGHGHEVEGLAYAANEAPTDPPIDPVLQLHPAYDVTSPAGPDFAQGPYPPLDDADAHGPDGQPIAAADRDGFRPHQLPRPIIPPDVDTSLVDLTYHRNPRSHSANNPGPDGWLYPHKKGIGTGSNLEAFKDEIEARTMRGENCKAISLALQGMGVQTSDKAISRVRIKWGMRKRSQRKIKTPPPDSDAARLTAKTKVQTLRKIEIKRMTEEGMTAEDIYDNLTSRGMELKKGVATVLRLQSAWKLTQNPKRWLENFRHQCHKKAKAQQVQAFKDIAKEMDLEDFDAWLEAKLAEQQVREARHELAIRLMGEHAPTVNRRKLQARRGEAQPTTGNEAGGQDEVQAWQEEQPNADHQDKAVSDASPFTGLDVANEHVLDPMDAHPGSDIAQADGGQDSAANVALRIFARADQDLSATSTAPATDYSRPSPSGAVGSPTATPRPAAAPRSKRGRGRSSKAKKSTAKSVSRTVPIPSHEAPVADMAPNASGAPPDLDLPVFSRPQGTHAPAFTSTTPAIPAAVLVLRPEEAEANRTTLSTLDQYKAAAGAYQEVLQARTDNMPLAGSLTGLPPSSKEVEAAKRKLKEVHQAMRLDLD